MMGGYAHQLLTVVLTVIVGVFGAFLIVRVALRDFFALAAVAGISGYTFAFLSGPLGMPVAYAVGVAVLMSIAAAGALTLALKFLDGHELVSFSLALQLGIEAVYDAWEPVTGGPSGIAAGGLDTADGLIVAAVAATAAAGVYAWFALTGRASASYLAAVAPVQASVFGLNPQRRTGAAIFAGATALGLFGITQSLTVGFVGPTSFGLSTSILLYLCVSLGGRYLTMWSCVVCAIFLVLMPEPFRFLGWDSAQAALLREITLGTLLVVFGAHTAVQRRVRLARADLARGPAGGVPGG